MGFFDRLRRVLPGRVPSDPLARATRALELGRLSAAEAALAEALAAAANPAELATVRNKRAILAIRRGQRELAVEELVLALEVDPRGVAALVTIGNLLLEDGDVTEAVEHYEYALLVDPDYGPAYHNLGVALHRQGRKGEAVRMLRKATRLETRMRR